MMRNRFKKDKALQDMEPLLKLLKKTPCVFFTDFQLT